MKLEEVVLKDSVTRAQIEGYAKVVGDSNPIHFDEEFARRAGMPSVIAPGPLTLSLALDAVVRQCGADSLAGVTIRFSAPVTPGDRLRIIPAGMSFEVRTEAGQKVA